MQVPESIAAAARARIHGATKQRERVLSALQSGRPLDAEDDDERKVKRIQAVVGVDRRAAERIARYEDPASIGLSEEAQRRAEAIQGATIDFVGISYLELARSAANSVCRVVLRDLQPLGSGLMISEQLFLTNNHVITSEADAREYRIEFNYEEDVDGRARPITRFALDPQSFFYTNNENDLDFTVVAVGERLSGSGDLAGFGYCPLIDSNDKHAKADFVNIIQHPEGDYKQIVLRENRIITRLEKVLHYLTDTLPGSSGSPVFNDQWEVLALHHWGEPFTEIFLPDGTKVQKEVNEGIRASAILHDLKDRESQFNPSEQQLLERVFNPPLRRPTVKVEKSKVDNRPASEPTPGVNSPATSQPASLQPVVGNDGVATWTIPLTISIRLGDQPPAVAQGAPDASSTTPATDIPGSAEAIRIDPNYSNRKGYNPDFLPGHRVALPALSEEQRALAGRRLQVASGENPFELKYQHFSIVMNSQRRMAFFTAVNIDGSDWIDIDRDSGQPRREASEVWYTDPRIAGADQTNQSLYDNQRPKRLFDRGHMVRRQDPTWGSDARAVRANADTFHFTNCVPQASNFNQRTQYWQGIEKYVLDNATSEQERVCVFTGPVLAADDPDYRDVQVPMLFWKILVRVEEGQLLATALLADQSSHIQSMPERLSEDFDDLSSVREYQSSVSEIERLTGLDFGSLREVDTFEPGGESAGEMRLLKSFEDISLQRYQRRSAKPKRS